MKKDEESIVHVNLNEIEPNEEQPRKQFEKESLNELKESIEQFGVIQPIIVRKKKINMKLLQEKDVGERQRKLN